MIRRSTPIGWPRRDPRHYRFAIPNAVWDYHLRPAEFVIFSYLCYHRPSGTLTPEVIATGVHMTTSTVKKYLDSLIAKKLMTLTHADWRNAPVNLTVKYTKTTD